MWVPHIEGKPIIRDDKYQAEFKFYIQNGHLAFLTKALMSDRRSWFSTSLRWQTKLGLIFLLGKGDGKGAGSMGI